MCVCLCVFFFQAEDGIRDFCLSRGLGLGASTLAKTQERHDLVMASANELMGDIQNADPYEVGVKLTTLQTQLQASYQVTAMLSQMSLVNFLR